MILIDANIFMYAAGRESPQRLPCQRFLDRIVAGGGPAVCTDAEVLQEILHRYRSLQLPEIGFQLFDAVTHLGIPILPVTDRAMAYARRFLEDYPALVVGMARALLLRGAGRAPDPGAPRRLMDLFLRGAGR